MEHKQLMQQLASGQEKAELGTRALQEANDRILFSKQRVAAMKARKAAMKVHFRCEVIFQISYTAIILGICEVQQNIASVIYA